MQSFSGMKDCFFGLHYDFHAKPNTKDIGAFTTPEAFGALLDAVRPDYVGVDAKGLPGIASYPTRYEDPAPGLVRDQMKIFRDETRKRGIRLYAHYSGLYEVAAVRNHPDWAARSREGVPNAECVSMVSPYVDRKMIPQLKELAGVYGLDGVWVDGDCWMVFEDYHPDFLRAFAEQTGHTGEIPADPDDPVRLEFRQFIRETYRRFVEHYCREVKKEFPNFEICSNYGFTYYDPRPTLPEIDFLSSDLFQAPEVRILTRSSAAQDKPWVNMIWGSTGSAGVWYTPDYSRYFLGLRHPSRVKRIAALTVAQGGGVQIYGGAMDQHGEITDYETPFMREIADFVRARQPFTQGGTPIRNAAMLLSAYDRGFDSGHDLLGKRSKIDPWFCDIALDCGRPIDLLLDHQVNPDGLRDRPAVLLADVAHFRPETEAALLDYAKAGGSLIVSGRTACRKFAAAADAAVTDYPGIAIYVESAPGNYCAAETAVVFPDGFGEPLCVCYDGKLDRHAPRVRAAVSVAYGKGRLYLIGFDLCSAYIKSRHFVLRDIMAAILRQADPTPTAYAEQTDARVELIPARQGGRTLLHVVNAAELPFEANGTGMGELPELREVKVALRLEQPPRQVTLEPGHRAADCEYRDGYLHVTLDRLHIHEMIVAE